MLGQPFTVGFELFKPLKKVMLKLRHIRTDINWVKWDRKQIVHRLQKEEASKYEVLKCRVAAMVSAKCDIKLT